MPVRADESRAAVSPSEICRADVIRADRTGIGGSAVFYAYTPDWIFAAYDLRRLDEPAFDGYAQDNKAGDPLRKADCCWKFGSPTVDIDWLNKSHITCTYPDAKVYVLASSALQKRAPKIAAFLANAEIDPKALNDLFLKIEKDKQPADVTAKAWVSANRSTVDK
ncbi:glycine betaine ABC transporter substrate-binding protein [Paraburkholderia sediminicola]|uniref:glycine betaine ABC transporter substrate-binding protein n=1 Tax=Paraburkholderia sediminicola TaxID=458836 RepID=UPI0038B7620B